MGLVAVTLLMFTVTPRSAGAPIAVSATTSPAGRTEVGVRTAPTATVSATVSVDSGESATMAAPVAAPVVAPAVELTASSTLRHEGGASALATPIGDGRLALMTSSGVAADPGREVDVRLTSGPVVTAVVDGTIPGLVVLSIDAEASGEKGHPIADEQPPPDEIVTVLADPPVTIAFSAVATVDAAEGTPVLDGDGELIGLCVERDDPEGSEHITLVDVTAGRVLGGRHADATTAAP